PEEAPEIEQHDSLEYGPEKPERGSRRREPHFFVVVAYCVGWMSGQLLHKAPIPRATTNILGYCFPRPLTDRKRIKSSHVAPEQKIFFISQQELAGIGTIIRLGADISKGQLQNCKGEFLVGVHDQWIVVQAAKEEKRRVDWDKTHQ
ncbi:hypothetical protein MYX82_14485, partial [Acidobacteria bacterium AH-259-D05]|nr:hypothetical protein [Acidobacteria bacterium AH-259-D05]